MASQTSTFKVFEGFMSVEVIITLLNRIKYNQLFYIGEGVVRALLVMTEFPPMAIYRRDIRVSPKNCTGVFLTVEGICCLLNDKKPEQNLFRL